MATDWFLKHWALAIASVLGLALLLFIGFRALKDSAAGRLRAARRNYDRCRRARSAQQRRTDACADKLAGLRQRSEDVSPRRIDEASEDFEDAKALLKILEDQVLVAAARLREIIVEEYPPRRHEALRRRYLGDDVPI